MALSVLCSISRRGHGAVSKLIDRSLSSSSSSVRSSRMSPGLMLHPITAESGDVVCEFIALAENNTVLSFKSCSGFDPKHDYDTLLGSSQGWLGLTNCAGDRLGLINPLTGHHIKLPARVITGTTPSGWELGLVLRGDSEPNMIVSCPPEQGECRALLVHGRWGNELAFCCPGLSNNDTWTRIGSMFYGSCVYSRRQKLFFCTRDDVKFVRGDFCADRRRVYLEAWDLRDPLSPKLIQTSPILGCSLRSGDDDDAETKDFLVINDDTDDLFLARRFINEKTLDLLSAKGRIDDYAYNDLRFGYSSSTMRKTYHRYSMRRAYHDHRYDEEDEDDDDDDSRPYKTIKFDVHKYDPESRSFRYMDPQGGSSLDGLSFLIDHKNGFALSSKEFPDLKPNSIYFTAWRPPAWDDTNFGGYDVGIYNYQDATISPCYYPSDSFNFRTMALEPWWFLPNTTTEAN